MPGVLFISPEKIRKLEIFWCFLGDRKRSVTWNGLRSLYNFFMSLFNTWKPVSYGMWCTRVFYKKNFLKENKSQKSKILKKMLRKSPASTAWAGIFKTTDFSL